MFRFLNEASHVGARQAVGRGREEPVVGCGTAERLCTAVGGVQRSLPRADAGYSVVKSACMPECRLLSLLVIHRACQVSLFNIFL